MNIVGKFVEHRIFGTGIVKKVHNGYIEVEFDGELKPFQYPFAFEKFLTATDADIQRALLNEIAAEIERREAERERAEVPQPHILPVKPEEPRPRRPVKRKPPRRDVAFKCTYCDGGKTAERVGFAGICSDEVMRHNVIGKGRAWCSNPASHCRQYLEGEISRDEMKEWPCYESRMLIDWRADAGVYHSGKKAGQPMVMRQVRPNSLCVLTSRKPNTTERERFIFGVFLVDESYEGEKREAGFVTTDSEFKVELTGTEAESMLFWKYHANAKQPQTPRWNTGLFRYLDREAAALILRDIAGIKKGTADETLAGRFFEHFCSIHDIDASVLPEPYGALTL